MNAFFSNRKQLRAERAHRRAVARATAHVSSQAVRREMLMWSTTSRMGM